MHLYDIHTHNPFAYDTSGNDEVDCILNVSPTTFMSDCADHTSIRFSCGIHPWHSGDMEKEIGVMQNIVDRPTVIAVGEIGLDKMHGPSLDIQMEVFERQLQIAACCGKPVIIHCVKAWDELIAIKRGGTDVKSWIIHGFRGNAQQAAQLLSHGFLLSIGLHFNKAALAVIPTESMFCETDTFVVPVNEVYRNVSSALNIDIERLAMEIEKNAKRVFSF